MKRLLLPALLLTTLTACTAAPAGTLPAAAPTPTPASVSYTHLTLPTKA